MKRWKSMVGLMTVAAMGLTACAGSGDDGRTDESETEQEAFVPEVVGAYEAEEAAFNGNVHMESDVQGYSGSGYVAGFSADDDSCTFRISIPEDGFYDFDFVSASSGDYKENYVNVDGESMGVISVSDKSFTDSLINRVYLSAGEHEVSVSKYWGWIYLDKLIVQTSEPLDTSIYEVSAALCNENATDSAKRLMSYLADNYGSNVLSGQYCDTGQFGKEFTVVQKETGKYPAVLGLDFIEYTPSRVEKGSSSKATDLAKQFWENGGIVTFCWHWNAPTKYLTGEWYSGFRTDATNIDLAKIMNGEDQEGYDLLMEDIDAIAQQLLILQEADVPILWRPLHEASGGWFWWGASGPEAYKQLYILLYDKLTNEYGINNLIWLWNGQDAEWYPGDEYVDIIGEDIYPGERVYTSQVNKYLEAVNYTNAGKMVVLSENGCVPDPELLVRDGAMWGFWCTWGTEFVAKSTAIYSYSDQYTETEMLKKAYDSDTVITLDELPDLKEYPIREQ
ncbi:MAG: glycosyl hydrolase [Roseburia sp.]